MINFGRGRCRNPLVVKLEHLTGVWMQYLEIFEKPSFIFLYSEPKKSMNGEPETFLYLFTKSYCMNSCLQGRQLKIWLQRNCASLIVMWWHGFTHPCSSHYLRNSKQRVSVFFFPATTELRPSPFIVFLSLSLSAILEHSLFFPYYMPQNALSKAFIPERRISRLLDSQFCFLFHQSYNCITTNYILYGDDKRFEYRMLARQEVKFNA